MNVGLSYEMTLRGNIPGTHGSALRSVHNQSLPGRGATSRQSECFPHSSTDEPMRASGCRVKSTVSMSIDTRPAAECRQQPARKCAVDGVAREPSAATAGDHRCACGAMKREPWPTTLTCHRMVRTAISSLESVMPTQIAFLRGFVRQTVSRRG